MGMLIFIVVMMFSGLKDCIEASIPERFPQGAEKIKLGYFKRLHVNGIRGDLIKLNDGRVLIYSISGNKTYIFDPKDDSFKRTAITDAPTFYHDCDYDHRSTTRNGITLKNGKVLLLSPKLRDDEKKTELDYYKSNTNYNTPEKTVIDKYYKNKTAETKSAALKYIRTHRPDLHKSFLEYKKEEDDAQHSYLYNPETEKLEQIGIAPIPNNSDTYKLLLKDGRVLIIGDTSESNMKNIAVIFHPDTNTFTELPQNHKILGYYSYTVLSTGDIFMFKNKKSYLYKYDTNTIIPKKEMSEISGYKSYNFALLNDDTVCYIYQSSNNKSQVVCYNPYTDKLISTPLFNVYEDQFPQIINNDLILVAGKEYTCRYSYRTGSQNKPDKHVKLYNPNTKEAKVLSRTSRTTLTESDTQSVLLDDGRVLIQNRDDTIDDYELFIPYSYKKQKREERKRLKQELKNK